MAHSPRKMLSPKAEKIEAGNAAELRSEVGEGSNRDFFKQIYLENISIAMIGFGVLFFQLFLSRNSFELKHLSSNTCFSFIDISYFCCIKVALEAVGSGSQMS